MKKNITIINASLQDTSRPSDRPPKTNWKTKIIQKGLTTLQLVSPGKTAEIVWHYFTKPGPVRFKDTHQPLLEKAETFTEDYKGYKIQGYKWGQEGPKILLVHGWRSKTFDFRRMIYALNDAGFVVVGLDMKAHGKSEGKYTAAPEMRDIIRNHYLKNGPYEAVIGYSIGGLASGVALSELPSDLLPKQFFVFSAPPFVRYFFKDIIDDLGFNNEVYEQMCKLIGVHYHEDIDYFDLRIKQNQLNKMELTLIYDETDQTVPFARGQELFEKYPEAHFIHTKGLGHYKIIAYEPLFDLIIEKLRKEVATNV